MRKIELSQGLCTKISDEDYSAVSALTWTAAQRTNTFYAVHGKQGLLLHRFIMKPEDGFVVHHKDRDGLNNQRDNLVIVTHQQNMSHMERAVRPHLPYRGITKTQSGYVVRFMFERKQQHIGSYPTLRAAVLAYNEAVLRIKGPGYFLNEVPQ